MQRMCSSSSSATGSLSNFEVYVVCCWAGGPVCWQGLDSNVCYAMCANGEVWSWAVVLSGERAPVGYKRALVFTKKTVSKGTSLRPNASDCPRVGFTLSVMKAWASKLNFSGVALTAFL